MEADTAVKAERSHNMATIISNRPALLLAQMRQIKAGLTKYAETYTPAGPSLLELEEAVSQLETSLASQIEAKGNAEAATQNLNATRDESILITRRMRDSIYAHFGKRDARIVEFGLDTLPTRKKKNGSNSNPGQG